MQKREDYSLDVPLDGPPAPSVPTLEHECTLSGVRLMALPPGQVEIGYVAKAHMLDVNLNALIHEQAVGSNRLRPQCCPADSVSWAPVGVDFRLRANNHLWGLLLEFDAERAHELVVERLDGRSLPRDFLNYRPRPRAALFARMAIDDLRRGGEDRLFLEGLALAILGDTLSSMDAPPSLGPAAPRGIARALDLIEARLGADLSLAEIAAAAGMSPSWFAESFRAAVGEPVFAYVRRRRLDRARAMIADRRLALGAIAHACGFADQSHMTRAFRRRWGG